MLLVKPIGVAGLGFLAIHLSSPHAPPTQNNQIVTKVIQLLTHVMDVIFFQLLITIHLQDTPPLRKLFAWMHVSLQNYFFEVEIDVGGVTWFRHCEESPNS